MKRATKKRLAIAAGAFGAVYAALSGFFLWAMSQPPEKFGRIMARVPMPLMAVLPFEPLWNIARAGALEVGDLAPDFELPTYDKRATVRLSDARGKSPVVLVFGSYT
ncbi:MAG: redoxin domain-containing protein [Acidobacteria bacterium]|nr:redoxin domain-containing protein [Acidobacteriota bacterium]